MAFWFYLTGGLHADGYMDTATAFFPAAAGKDAGNPEGQPRRFRRRHGLRLFGPFKSDLFEPARTESGDAEPRGRPGGQVRFGTLISIFQFPYARKEGLGKAFVTYAPPHTTAKALVLALLPVFLCGPFYLAS